VETGSASNVYCFAVHALTAEASSDVEVHAFTVTDAAPWLVQDSSDAVVPASALTISGTGSATVVSLDATLPRLDAVHLQIFTQGPIVVAAQNDTCPVYPLHFELHSPSQQIEPVWRITGTVSAESVVEYGPTCSDAFIGTTSGIWRVVGVA
jgi:hypothetical protein